MSLSEAQILSSRVSESSLSVSKPIKVGLLALCFFSHDHDELACGNQNLVRADHANSRHRRGCRRHRLRQPLFSFRRGVARVDYAPHQSCLRKLSVRLKASLIQASRFFPLLDMAPVQGAEPIRQASPKGHAYERVIGGNHLC